MKANEYRKVEDSLFARIVLEDSLLAPEQVRDAQDIVKMLADGGDYRPMAEVISWQRLLNPAQVKKIQRRIRRSFINCPRCQNLIDFADKGPGKPFPCPTCAVELIARPRVGPSGAGADFLDEAQFGFIAVEAEAGGKETVKSVKGPAIGKYEILGELGRGGMGVVYKVRQTGYSRFLALKVLIGMDQPDENLVKRFRKEVEASSRLSHPNIVGIHDVGFEDGKHFFTMDYIEGTSLDERIYDQTLSPKEALDIARKVAEAIHHSHQKGVVHRDLKPANIMIRGDGEPIVMDFGLAKTLEKGLSLTETGAVMGTPSYMSPEQAAGDTHLIGPLSDVYSLGAVLYEMLTLSPPFTGDTPINIIIQIMNDEPRPPRHRVPHVHRDVEIICMKALAKEASRRYESAEAFAQDIERYLRGEAIAARPPSFRYRVIRRARKYKIAVVLGIVLLLSLIGFGGYLGVSSWLEQNRVDTLVDRARTAQAEGRWDDAGEHWAQVLALEEDNEEARAGLAEAETQETADLAHREEETKKTVRRETWDEAQKKAAEDREREERGKKKQIFDRAVALLGKAGEAFKRDQLTEAEDIVRKGRRLELDAVLDARFEQLGLMVKDRRETLRDKVRNDKIGRYLQMAVEMKDHGKNFEMKGKMERAVQFYNDAFRAVLQAEKMCKGDDFETLHVRDKKAIVGLTHLAGVLFKEEQIKEIEDTVLHWFPPEDQEANAWRKRLADLKPKLSDYREKLENARVFMDQGLLDDAWTDLQHAREIFESSRVHAAVARYEFLRNMDDGMKLARSGSWVESIQAFEKALRLRSGSEEARARLLEAREQASNRALAEAKSYYREAFRERELRETVNAWKKRRESLLRTALQEAEKAISHLEAPSCARWERSLKILLQIGGTEVFVPADVYPLGSRDPEDRNPPRQVYLPAFYLDAHEVTHEEYARFMETGGYLRKEFWDDEGWKHVREFTMKDGGSFGPATWAGGTWPSGAARCPVQGVCWYEARAYARFAGKRLPTPEEWETAASFDPYRWRKRIYPWGDVFEREKGIFGGSVKPCTRFEPADRSPFGMVDAGGNVAEWVAGGDSSAPAPYIKGAYIEAPIVSSQARSSRLNRPRFPFLRGAFLGFRCAWTPAEAIFQEKAREMEQTPGEGDAEPVPPEAASLPDAEGASTLRVEEAKRRKFLQKIEAARTRFRLNDLEGAEASLDALEKEDLPGDFRLDIQHLRAEMKKRRSALKEHASRKELLAHIEKAKEHIEAADLLAREKGKAKAVDSYRAAWNLCLEIRGKLSEREARDLGIPGLLEELGLNRLYRHYMEREEWPRAEEILNALPSNRPEAVMARKQYDTVQARLGEFEKAVREAETLMRTGEAEIAVERIEFAVRIYPTLKARDALHRAKYLVWLEEGRNAASTDEWELSIAAFEKALQYKPEGNEAREGLQAVRGKAADHHLEKARSAYAAAFRDPGKRIGKGGRPADAVLRRTLIHLRRAEGFAKTEMTVRWTAAIETLVSAPEYRAVFVPDGRYPVGSSDPGDGNPPREVSLTGFFVELHEVTNRAFADFVTANGYHRREFWDAQGWKHVGEFTCEEGDFRGPAVWKEGKPPVEELDRPVRGVCWFEARAFARFAGKRLATSEEWEVACSFDAVTGRARVYPWGEAFSKEKGVFKAPTRPVHREGNEDRSPFGLFDASGNVAEWVDLPRGREVKAALKGGYADAPLPESLARAPRINLPSTPLMREPFLGFRCAWTPGEKPD